MGIGSLLERIGTVMQYDEAIEILFDKWETVCDHLDILREDMNKLDKKYRSSVDTYNETRESMKGRIATMKERSEHLRQAMNALGAGE
jgi:prefoldin subunit 5